MGTASRPQLGDLTIFLDQHAAPLLREYLASDDGRPRFTGSLFDTLGGGGDVPECRNRYASDDIVATTMLAVDVPREAAAWMLVSGSADLTRLLEEIPAEVDLIDADRTLIEDNSPADRLWGLLKERDGIGWVIAGKLVARKRPRLIPVYDDVVRTAVGAPKDFWLALWEQFRDNGSLSTELRRVRSDAGADRLSSLRVLDIVIWMRNHGKKWARSQELRNLSAVRVTK
jgi:hypothetical protein